MHINLTITDSIGIAVYGEGIIQGVGNELHTHSHRGATKRLKFKLKGKVHGIVKGEKPNAETFIVYGEREFKILDYHIQSQGFHCTYEGELTDWIIGACFLSGSEEFVLLTAHSVLLHYKSGQLVARYSCADKSTLYCGHLHGNLMEKLVVFGGNAFGELLIWQPAKFEREAVEHKPLPTPLLQRLTAHNGVIFSIDYDEQAGILTTTSDDRSIRFWRVCGVVNNDWQQMKCTQIASGYGHTARVFCGKIISYDEEKYAVTVGEDSFLCVWRTNGALLHKCRQQFGAIIWNFVYDKLTNVLYTVGSTGNVLPFNLSKVFAKNQEHAYLLPALPDETEYVTKIKFMQENMLIGVTNKNNLAYYELNKNTEWQALERLENFKCTVLEIFEDNIILCGYKRLIFYTYKHEKFSKILDISLLESIIRSVQFLLGRHALISDDLGNCCFLQDLFVYLQPHCIPIELPQCKESWITSSLLIPSEESAVSGDYLLASNRQGNLLLFQRQGEDKFAHVDTLRQVHGNLGSTALHLLENYLLEAFVCSAGRDGGTRVLRINKTTAKLEAYSRKRIPVAWVEHIIEPKKMQNLYLGFNDNHFVAWSEQHDFLAKVPCGGGHRCWHYYLNNEQELRLVFIQHRRVHCEKMHLFEAPKKIPYLPARHNWHVKACNIATGWPFFVSAGEDNLIKISKFTENSLMEKLEIDTHISNVRALKIFRPSINMENDQFILLISGGGRAQLCVHEAFPDSRRVRVRLNYTIKNVENNENTLKHEKQLYRFDPETRIMAIDALICEETMNLHIFMACSDAYLRKLTVHYATYEVKALKQIFMQRCVLQTCLIDSNTLIAATTDGLLRFYDTQLEQEVRAPLAHHASGVNALDIVVLDEHVHILSGGDDQCVTYSLLKLPALKVLQTYKLTSLHTAQVTAVAIDSDCEYAVTSGVDQQVFKINLKNGDILARKTTCVADVKGVRIWPFANGCVIYGCGLQFITI